MPSAASPDLQGKEISGHGLACLVTKPRNNNLCLIYQMVNNPSVSEFRLNNLAKWKCVEVKNGKSSVEYISLKVWLEV